MTALDKSYFDEFCKIGKLRNVKKGECLYDLNRINDRIYCLENGLCALVSVTKSGEEKVYNYFSAGDLMNFTPAYLTLPLDTSSGAFYVYAKTECKVSEISYEAFYKLLSDNPHFNRYVLSLFANQVNTLLSHFHFMQEASTPSRLCKTLLDFSYICGKRRIVNKHFSYVELSKYLGVHTVTVSRIMRSLKQLGAIEKDGHLIVIKDTHILEEYIQETKMLPY